MNPSVRLPAHAPWFASLLCLLGTLAGAAPIRDLAADVELLPGRFVAGSQPDGNSVLIHAEDGLIVFDAGRHPEHADALLAAATSAAPAALTLVNSHWHLDHSGGLIRLRARYPQAELFASTAIEQARHGFLARYRAQLQAFAEHPVAGGPSAEVIRSETDLIDGSAAMQPSEVVSGARDVLWYGRDIHLGLGRGVSGGDVWLFDRASRVLAAGDLVTQPAPLFDTGCASRWSRDLATLSEQPFEMLVPGHGAPMNRAAFESWRRDFDALVHCAASDAPRAACREGWLSGQAARLSEVDHSLAAELLNYYLDGPLSAEGQAQRCAGDDAAD